MERPECWNPRVRTRVIWTRIWIAHAPERGAAFDPDEDEDEDSPTDYSYQTRGCAVGEGRLGVGKFLVTEVCLVHLRDNASAYGNRGAARREHAMNIGDPPRMTY